MWEPGPLPGGRFGRLTTGCPCSGFAWPLGRLRGVGVLAGLGLDAREMASCGVAEVAAEGTWLGTTREVRKPHLRGRAGPSSVPDVWGMVREGVGLRPTAAVPR